MEGEMYNKRCRNSFPLAFASIAVAALLLPARAQQAQSNLPVCPLIATGGTIAMKIDPVKHAPVPAISGEDLLATVPEVAD
jgi:L-asparaginase